MTRVRGKSRTGGPFHRAGLSFRADAWTVVDVSDEVLAVLRAEPWLDVRDAPGAPDAVVAAPETDDLAGRLRAALARIADLERQLEARRAAHEADLEALTAPATAPTKGE